MSQENVDRQRQALAAFNRRDRTAWLELCDPEFETVPSGDWPERREMRGKASGAGVVYDYWLVVTYRNGKALRAEWFADRAEALEAAGPSE
jgi:ketosteroid isomerase-like protein